MQTVRRLLALFLLIFLLLAVPFTLTAQPPPPQNNETAVGQPHQFTITVQERMPAATAADRFAFLPYISGIVGSGDDGGGDGGGVSSEAAQVVELVNNERAQAGCPPLQISSQLAAAALGHSKDMADNDYFSHTSLDGRAFWQRIEAQGYSFWSAGENIAAGYQTPAAVMAGWMDSSGHRANILDCDFKDIGVGYYYLANDSGDLNYRHYWTQDFGTRR